MVSVVMTNVDSMISMVVAAGISEMARVVEGEVWLNLLCEQWFIDTSTSSPVSYCGAAVEELS